MKLHIPGLPQIVQYAFDKLLNKGIGWDNLSDDVRGVLAGIVFDSTIPLDDVPGFIPALGATYLRADYPYFWSCIKSGGNIVDETTWQTEKQYGSYSYGDGETTFRAPLIVDFVRGFDPTSGQTMGQWVEDTFQGHWHQLYRTYNSAASNIASDVGMRDNNITVAYSEKPVREAISDGVNGTPRTGPETAPKHVLLPKYIYTGEVW